MHKLTERFKETLNTYENFKAKLDSLIRDLLQQNNINFHKIESRVKGIANLDEKITRKNEKYEKLADITDIVGIRIITYFEDEVDKIATIMKSEFTIDIENSIDKRQLDADKFGYRSLHFVLSLKNDRKKLTEYKKFKDLNFEIQIRSVLQHAWAEIEHDIGYKNEISIPDILKRSFYRVAALLETADIEFVNIKKELEHYKYSLEENIKNTPEAVDLNLLSLTAFMEENKNIKILDESLALHNNLQLLSNQFEANNILTKLDFLKINTVKDLEIALEQYSKYILPFSKLWYKTRNQNGKVSRGISIFYLCYIILGQMNDIKLAEEYITYQFGEGVKGAQEIIDIYKKISQ